MKRHLNIGSVLKNQQGVSAIIVAIVLLVLLCFAALAIDVGYLYSTKNELQNVADAAALASTRELGSIYQTLSYQEQQTYVCDPVPIRTVAKDVALKNQAARVSIVVNDADVIIGKWDPDTLSLTPTLNQPNAVRVITRRDSSANNPVTTFFATFLNFFGGNFDTVGINADAVAALSGKGEVNPAELELPIGIDEKWITDKINEIDGFCGKLIKFSPTTDPEACGGWTTWTFGSNDSNMRKILEGQLTNTLLGTNDLIEFTGGDLSNPTFADLLTLFGERGYDVAYESGGSQQVNPINDKLYVPGEPPVPAVADADGNPVPGPLNANTPAEGVYPLFERDKDGNFVLDNGNKVPLTYPNGKNRNAHVWVTSVVVYEENECDNPNQQLAIKGFATILLTDVYNAPDKLVEGRILCDYVSPDPSRGNGSYFGTLGPIPGLVE